MDFEFEISKISGLNGQFAQSCWVSVPGTNPTVPLIDSISSH